LPIELYGTENAKAHLKHTITSTPAKYKLAALQKRKDMKRKNIKNEMKILEVIYV
jgi:predicted Ser/Thr protein kinase